MSVLILHSMLQSQPPLSNAAVPGGSGIRRGVARGQAHVKSPSAHGHHLVYKKKPFLAMPFYVFPAFRVSCSPTPEGEHFFLDKRPESAIIMLKLAMRRSAHGSFPVSESSRLVQGNGGEGAHTAPSRSLKASWRCVGGIRCAGYRAVGIIAFPDEKRLALKSGSGTVTLFTFLRHRLGDFFIPTAYALKG